MRMVIFRSNRIVARTFMAPCTCPGCQARLQIPDTMAGKKVRCPKCKVPFAVPAADAAETPVATRTPAAPPAAPPAPAKPLVTSAVRFEAVSEQPRSTAAIQPAKKPAAASRARKTDDDDDDFAERPRSGNRSVAAKPAIPWLLVAIIGGGVGLVLSLIVGGFLFYFLSFKGADGQVAVVKPIDKKDNLDQPPEKQKPDFERPIDPLPGAIAPDVTQRVKKSTVQLRVNFANGASGEGSGFFAIEPGLVVSNAHVLGMLHTGEKPKKIDVVINSGEPTEEHRSATVLGVDQDDDLALLQLDGDRSSLPPPLAVDYLSQLAELQKVYVFGFPFGNQLGKSITVSESSISSFRRNKEGALHQIQVNGGMHSGNSGGPVVDARGNVIGVSVAVIKGTLINFAIPGEKVHGMIQGRILTSRFGEPFRDNDSVRMPYRVTCLDPMSRVKGVKIESWTGPAGGPRQAGAPRHTPQVGDGAKKTLPLAYAQNQGQVDLQVPPIPPGQVLWVQPAIQQATGQFLWGPALAVPAFTAAPLDRVPANLTLNFTDVTERTLDLTSKLSLQLFAGNKKLDIAQRLETEALETIQPLGADFKVKLDIGKVVVKNTVDDKPPAFNSQAIEMFKSFPHGFTLNPKGKWLKHTVPNWNPSIDGEARRSADEIVGLFMNSYEATALDLPQRQTRPMETWTTTVSMMFGSGQVKSPADVNFTCTYEGMRTVGAAKEAFVRLEGDIRPRMRKDAIKGIVQGFALVDLDRGFLSKVNVSIRSDVEKGDQYAINTFETTVIRSIGNPRGIKPAPTAVGPGPGPVAKAPAPLQGTVVFRREGTLKPDDAIYAEQKAPHQAISVELIAGKSYAIDLASKAIDPFLYLENPDGKIIAKDDDGGGELNARIVLVAPKSGSYRIIVTAFGVVEAPGAFTLRVFDLEKVPGINGKVVFEKAGTLAAADPVHPIKNQPHQVVAIKGMPGKNYMIEVSQPAGQDVDLYIAVEDKNGKLVSNNITPNNQIHRTMGFNPKVASEHRLIITSFEPVEKANFAVRVIELGGDAFVPVAPYPMKFLKQAEPKAKVDPAFQPDAILSRIAVPEQFDMRIDRPIYFVCSFCNLR